MALNIAVAPGSCRHRHVDAGHPRWPSIISMLSTSGTWSVARAAPLHGGRAHRGAGRLLTRERRRSYGRPAAAGCREGGQPRRSGERIADDRHLGTRLPASTRREELVGVEPTSPPSSTTVPPRTKVAHGPRNRAVPCMSGGTATGLRPGVEAGGNPPHVTGRLRHPRAQTRSRLESGTPLPGPRGAQTTPFGIPVVPPVYSIRTSSSLPPAPRRPSPASAPGPARHQADGAGPGRALAARRPPSSPPESQRHAPPETSPRSRSTWPERLLWNTAATVSAVVPNRSPARRRRTGSWC